MHIETLCSNQQSLEQTLDQLQDNLKNKPIPSLLIMYLSEQDNLQRLPSLFKQKLGDIRFIGCTSCLGVMSHAGHHDDGMGIMSLTDGDGVFGVGFSQIDDNEPTSARQAGHQALLNALQDSGRAGELPAFILLHSSPYFEEAVIEGITQVLGNSVPIIGGSAADNKVAGNWTVFSNAGVAQSGVVISVCYPSCEIGLSFYSGYDPTEFSGVVTQTNGREIITIDHEPAAQVYTRWTNGLNGDIEASNNILAASSLSPLGRRMEKVEGYPFFMLSHPSKVTEKNGICLFSNVSVGETVYLMQGCKSSLITRAGRVTQSALDGSQQLSNNISGALIVFCAGCMLCIDEEMGQVVNGINQCLNGVQFLGAYTFGEQGQMPDNANGHGNLMISALLFFDK